MEKEEEKTKPYKAHVLVVPYPAQGHINPMLQFSKRLVSRGIKPTLVNTVFISKSMHADPDDQIGIETISDGYDEGGVAQAETTESYLASLESVGSKTLRDLIKRLDDSGKSVDAIIYDGFVYWALNVAKQFRKLGAVFFTQSCTVNNVYYHVHRGLLPLPLSGAMVSLPGSLPLKPEETPSFLHIYGSYPGFFHTILNQFSNVDEADFVLVNTFYELEKQVVDSLTTVVPFKTIGPAIPSIYLDKRLANDRDYVVNLFKPDTQACLNWLHDKPANSVVYVSFGSMADLGAPQVEELARGLKDSNHYFLWVVRASEMAKLPPKFVDETAGTGLVVSWAPQLEVLAHKSLGCFVTHCGWNSVLEAISLGVPMVAVPQWTDQVTNAKYVEDCWGMGIRTCKNEEGIVTREEIKKCIEEVMEEGGRKKQLIKKNAERWSELARAAVDEGGSSDRNIDEFVRELLIPLA